MPHSTDNSDPTGPLDLGCVLGQSHAFGPVAGRCSAAQAAYLHQLRKTRDFRRVTRCWRAATSPIPTVTHTLSKPVLCPVCPELNPNIEARESVPGPRSFFR
jgi:hypothetical protein